VHMTDFNVVLTGASYASAAASCLDMLAAAARLAPRVMSPIPEWTVSSLDGGILQLGESFSLNTSSLRRLGAHNRSVWILPALNAENTDELEDQIRRPDMTELALLVGMHVRSGGAVAAAASSVLLLHAAGVLRGRRVTTSKLFAGRLASSDAAVRVSSERTLCVDGPVITCSECFSQAEMIMFLISRFGGPSMRELMNGTWLREEGDTLPSLTARDALIAKIVTMIENSLPEPFSVARLAQELHLSERTLSRHVRSVTGKSTIALLQDVKARRARALLERSRLPIDQIAAEVGYSDSTALRRLMKRRTGNQPSHYRSASFPAS